jgi:hypothetical protein
MIDSRLLCPSSHRDQSWSGSQAISSTVGFVLRSDNFAKTKERIGAQTQLCLFMRTLNVGPAGNGERLRLIAHLGFALFDTNRGRPTVKIRPTLRGFFAR